MNNDLNPTNEEVVGVLRVLPKQIGVRFFPPPTQIGIDGSVERKTMLLHLLIEDIRITFVNIGANERGDGECGERKSNFLAVIV